MTTRRRFTGIFFLMAGLLQPALAAAQPTPDAPSAPAAHRTAGPGDPSPEANEAVADTARELFERGSKAGDEGKHATCRALLLAAWSLKPHAQIALNLGGCELRLGLYIDATQHLGYFLREAPPTTPPARRADAEAMYNEASAHVARLVLRTDPVDVEATIDGVDMGRGPWLHELVLEPGSRTIELRDEGREPATLRTVGAAGIRETITRTLPPADPAPRSSPPSSPTPTDPPPRPLHPITPLAVGGLVLSVVAIGGGLVLRGGAAASATDADLLLEGMRSQGVSCARTPALTACQDLLRLREQHDDLANAGTGLLIGGAVLGVGTAVYLALGSKLNPEPTTSSRSLKLTPAVGAGTGGLLLQGRF